jgi:hypothetical protein
VCVADGGSWVGCVCDGGEHAHAGEGDAVHRDCDCQVARFGVRVSERDRAAGEAGELADEPWCGFFGGGDAEDDAVFAGAFVLDAGAAVGDEDGEVDKLLNEFAG